MGYGFKSLLEFTYNKIDVMSYKLCFLEGVLVVFLPVVAFTWIKQYYIITLVLLDVIFVLSIYIYKIICAHDMIQSRIKINIIPRDYHCFAIQFHLDSETGHPFTT